MTLVNLREMLIRHEGLRLSVYRDSVGKLTIGYGHNLDDKPISKRAALVILDDDIADAENDLIEWLGNWYYDLDDTRKCIAIDMCFNMGIGGLKGFKRMFLAMRNGDFEKAAQEMLNSKWAAQVGNRAVELAELMRNG